MELLERFQVAQPGGFFNEVDQIRTTQRMVWKVMRPPPLEHVRLAIGDNAANASEKRRLPKAS